MNKHYHFIGIGGIGMGALASLLMSKGQMVSGSDIRSNQLTSQLQKQGARITLGHHAANIDQADVIIYSTAINKDNPEWLLANERNIPLMQRAELLAELMQDHISLTIAGAHGKTTTSAMTANLLIDAGLEPTTAVGGIVHETGSHARLGQGKYFVAEVDESDGSFLKFRPDYSVITNMDLEHIDYYKNWENITKSYKQFIRQTKDTGRLIVYGQDARLMRLTRDNAKDYITFGLSKECDVYADHIKSLHGKTHFRVIVKNKELGHFTLFVCGQHNILNALATICVGLCLSMDSSTIISSLKQFKGVKRRFQHIGEVNDVIIIDDYAHHPTEITMTLDAALSYNRKRVIGVFQPHRYSRFSYFKQEFIESLMKCDHCVVTDIYGAGEQPITGVSAQHFVESMRKHYQKPLDYVPKEKLITHLQKLSAKGDLILTLGAGDINKIASGLLQALQEPSLAKNADQSKEAASQLRDKGRALGRVGVLMGGVSSEREISLKSGKAIVNALQAEGCEVVGLDLTDSDSPALVKRIQSENIDIVFIALHGSFGEDGSLQSLLESHDILFTGSSVLASRQAFDKSITQKLFKNNGIVVPAYVTLIRDQLFNINEMILKLDAFPIVVKPACEGSSFGITIVKKIDELKPAIDTAFEFGPTVLCERCISGREMTVGVLGNTALPVVEIFHNYEYFDFKAKYDPGASEYKVPAGIPDEITNEIQNIALKAHQILNCEDFSRTDFILKNNDCPYVLELNTIPGFTETSLLPKAAKEIGIDFNNLILNILEIAYGKKKKSKRAALWS